MRYLRQLRSAASNDLQNLIATASPMEPALNKIHHFLNPQLITSLIQEQPDPYLSFRFFIWTTNFTRFRNWFSDNLIIDKLLCKCSSNKQEIEKGNGNEKKQECEKSGEELFDLYWSVLDEVKEGNYDVGSGAFGVLIKAYGRVGKAEKAVEAFGRMKEFGCEANLCTYNAILRVLVEKEATLLALEVFNTILKSNFKPDRSTFNILINGLCKNGRVEEAIKTFDEMMDRGIVPNRIPYMVVLKGLCRAKRVDDAYGLFRTMRSSGCEPDSVTYTVLVDGFCRTGRIGQALELSESFGEAGYVMGLRGYSSLINELVKTNRTDVAFQLFWKIFKLGITPDVVLYTIMIHGLCRMRRLKDAVNLARDMTDRGLVPDTPCYNTLIKGFCDMGLLDQARSLWLEISKSGCIPDKYTYSILIRGMRMNGLVDEAQQIFNDMEKFGCSASVHTFNALIDGLCKAGKLEEARLILYKMEIGKNPSVCFRLSQGAYRVFDSKSLQMMVKKLCESGLVLKAYKILTQLADEVEPDICTYNTLISGFCKVGKVDDALKLYEELHLKGNSPDLITYVTLIDGLLRVGREVDGIKFYEIVSKSEFSHLPEADKVLMKWHCRRRKTSFALSIWLKHQKSLVDGQDDETLRFVGKLVETDDMVRALKLLLKRDIKLKHMDSEPYNIILIGLCQARRTNEAMELFLILKETSWYISPPSCVFLISYLLREQNIDHAVDVFLYSLEKGFHLVPQVCNNLIGSLLRWQGRATDAFHLLKQMKYTGYDLNAYLHDGTRFLLYRQWSTRSNENDTLKWDDFSAKNHLPLPAVTKWRKLQKTPSDGFLNQSVLVENDNWQLRHVRLVIAHGINAGDVKKLQDAGIHTCNGLMMHTKKNLTGITGLSEAKVDKICEAVEKIVNFGYITGSEALLKRKAVIKISTGSQALDELLGGGIETNAITEAFGEFRSGKTQLVHTVCVCTQLPPNRGGGNGKVAFIDTEGTFRPDRIVPIAERFGMDPGAVLDNIIYARAYTYEHQYNLLLGLAAKMSEEPFRLLIVDSIIALFRVDFTGRGELADRQQKLAQMLSRLIKIAEEFNVAVYLTNQVIADPAGGVFISDPKKPAGEHVLAHAATIRLMFRKGKGEQRVCKVFNAPNLPEAEAIFQITPGGIADAKD